MMRLYIFILSLLLQGFLFIPCVLASDASLDWQQAIHAARAGDVDFAFMHFTTITELYPHSRYAMGAQFAQGEYYFQHHDWAMASKTFKNLISEYPRYVETVAALAYLYKIAQIENKPEDLKIYSDKAGSFNQLTFIFKEKKAYSFVSGLGHQHKLIFTINAIELYVESRLLTKIPL